MSCSYNAELALGFGREIRSVVEHPDTALAFPDFRLSPKFTAAESWRTEAGGIYNAVGLQGTTSGRPANLLVVDDPIKSREDAESMRQRNKTWSYYTSALATRLQPTHDNRPAKQLIILTRWNLDDLAGRLMDSHDWHSGRWEHINYKAIRSETVSSNVMRTKLPADHKLFIDPKTPDGKAELMRLIKIAQAPSAKPLPQKDKLEATVFERRDYALWPARFPLDELRRRERLDPHDFASLYQQEPYVLGGNIIKSAWWQRHNYSASPVEFQSIIIGADTAFKKSQTADYSVALVGGVDLIGRIHIIDVMRVRLDYPELRQRLILMNNMWRGRGLRGFYIEDKASGQSIIQDLKRTTGMAVIPYKVHGDKMTRLQAVLPLIEGGRVVLPEQAPWLDDFMDECISFPSGRNDDQVDAMVMVLDVLSKVALSPDMMMQHIDVGQSLNQFSAASRTGHPGEGQGQGYAQGYGQSQTSELEAVFPRDGQGRSPVSGRPNSQSPFGRSLSAALKSSKWGGWGA